MKFVNECGCIVDYSILEKAIIDECKRRNITPNNCYKIYMYRGYAGISIKHDKVSVHRILGKYMIGCDLPRNVIVHHIDKNKMNIARRTCGLTNYRATLNTLNCGDFLKI